jgi:hypothetical protein
VTPFAKDILRRLRADKRGSATLRDLSPNRTRAMLTATAIALRALRFHGYVDLRRDNRWQTTRKGQLEGKDHPLPNEAL